MKKRKLLAIPLVGLAMLGIVSCGEEKIDQTTTTPAVSSTITEPEGVKLSNLVVDANNMKTTYYEGQNLDFTGIIVKARYTDGTLKEITNYTYDESTYSPNQKGDQYVRLVYTEDGVTKTRSVHVVVKSVLDQVNNVIGITAKINKTTYKYQEELNLSDLVVTAYYEDGTTKVLADDQYTVNKDSFDSSKRGDYEIGVSFKEDYTIEGITRSCEVETCIFASVILNLDSIKITKGASSFLQYSNIDISNWEVEVTYKEGVKETIKEGFTTNIKDIFNDSSEVKTSPVTASFTYNGVTKTATRTVEIIPTSKTFNAGAVDITSKPAQENKEIEGFTLNKGYMITADSQSCGCQSFARSILLDGAGTREEYSVKFEVKRDKTITVVAASQEGSEIGLYDADGNVVKTYKVGTSLQRYTFDVDDQGVYYIWSNGGLSIYFIGTYRQ